MIPVRFAPLPNPFVSVVICTYRRRQALQRLLQTLVFQTDYPYFEIIVVEREPQEEFDVAAFTSSLGERFRYVCVGPSSLPRQRNIGLGAARGEVILFLDDDIVSDPSLIAAHAASYRDGRIAGVGGPDLEGGARVRPYGALGAKERRIMRRCSQSNLIDVDFAHFTRWLRGSNMSFRTAVLCGIGGFDERMHFFSDIDVCLTLRRRGFLLKYSPALGVQHLRLWTGGMRADFDSPQWGFRRGHDTYLFLRKHPGWAWWQLRLSLGELLRYSLKKRLLSRGNGLLFFVAYLRGIGTAYVQGSGKPNARNSIQARRKRRLRFPVGPLHKPFISVIISTYNRQTLLRELLDSLAREVTYDPFEVIVVERDPAQPFDPAAYTKRWGECFVYRRVASSSLSRQRNLGLALAKGQVALFLDDDIILKGNLLEHHAAAYADPRVAGAGGPVFGATEYLRSFAELGWQDRYVYRKVSNPIISDVNFAHYVSWLNGLNMSFRIDLLQRIGFFDELLNFYDDVDIARRIRDTGFLLKYIPGAGVRHLRFWQGGVRSDFPSCRWMRERGHDTARFFLKHPAPLSQLLRYYCKECHAYLFRRHAVRCVGGGLFCVAYACGMIEAWSQMRSREKQEFVSFQEQ